MAIKVPQSRPAKAADAGARVDIWTVRLDATAQSIEAAEKCLPDEERTRAEQFRNLVARRNYVIAHAALRRILGKQLEVEPREIQFTTGAQGKPALAGGAAGRLEFNLTHSGDLALVALSAQATVGVDVERVRSMPDALRLAERFFAAEETTQLKAVPEADRAATFLNLWTRKEALTKALGVGIVDSLARFSVNHGTTATVTAIDGDTRRAAEWTLHGFTPAAGYVAAAAVQSPQARFELHEFTYAITQLPGLG